jgi:hypothetical protein
VRSRTSKNANQCINYGKRTRQKCRVECEGHRLLRAIEIECEKSRGKAERGRSRIIRNYLFRIYDKLGVSTRVELVLYFFAGTRKQIFRATFLNVMLERRDRTFYAPLLTPSVSAGARWPSPLEIHRREL